MRMIFVLAVALTLVSTTSWETAAQSVIQALDPMDHPTPPELPRQGPHKGTLKVVGNFQVETVVANDGLKVYLYSRNGQSLPVQSVRGLASFAVEGKAKRFRYELFPSGDNALKIELDLSHIAGRQIVVDYQLVGLASKTIAYQDVAVVPADPTEANAVAITRQKVCPVSGKSLGSMGGPVAVDAAGKRVFVCCAGCIKDVKANPAKYANVRPRVEIVALTAVDAPLVITQATCPVMEEPLGSMGQTIKLLVGGQPMFLCCKGCIKKVQADPEKYLALISNPSIQGTGIQGMGIKGMGIKGTGTYGTDATGTGTGTAGAGTTATVAAATKAIRPNVYHVSDADQHFIAIQKRCPVMDEPLDAMGGPFRVNTNGKVIYICCPGCAKKISADPDRYLAVLKSQGVEPPTLR